MGALWIPLFTLFSLLHYEFISMGECGWLLNIFNTWIIMYSCVSFIEGNGMGNFGS